MSQRSATVLGVYNRTFYIERSVVSTANSYVLKSANGKAYGKATAKRGQSHGKAKGKATAKPRQSHGKATAKQRAKPRQSHGKAKGKATEKSPKHFTR